jgi:hypothetical protein
MPGESQSLAIAHELDPSDRFAPRHIRRQFQSSGLGEGSKLRRDVGRSGMIFIVLFSSLATHTIFNWHLFHFSVVATIFWYP